MMPMNMILIINQPFVSIFFFKGYYFCWVKYRFSIDLDGQATAEASFLWFRRTLSSEEALSVIYCIPHP